MHPKFKIGETVRIVKGSPMLVGWVGANGASIWHEETRDWYVGRTGKIKTISTINGKFTYALDWLAWLDEDQLESVFVLHDN